MSGNTRYRPACSLWPCGTRTRWPPSRGFTVSSSVPPPPRFSQRDNNVGPVKSFFRVFFEFSCHLFSFFERTNPFTPKSGLVRFVHLCFDDHGSFVIFSVGFSPTQTSLRSVPRPRLLVRTPFAGSGMPIQVDDVLLHGMTGTELSHVRTEL